MSSSIRLHPTKGVNPKLTYCPRCGGDSNEIILPGADDGKYECNACQTNVFGQGNNRCPRCNMPGELKRIGTIGDHEKLPASRPCDECRKELAEHKAVVEAGGIYFKCKDCHAEGAILASAPIAGMVREKMGVAAPAPCGVEFTKDQCPVCGDKSGVTT